MAKKRKYTPFEKQKMKEAAEQIGAYLTQFEADPAINTVRKGAPKYFQPTVETSNRHVWIRYRSDVLGGLDLSLGEAYRYLTWLKAGNTGTYYEMIGKTPEQFHFGVNPDSG
jgi:hypothetical protein